MENILKWFLIAGVIQFIVGILVIGGILLVPILILRSMFGGRSGGGGGNGNTTVVGAAPRRAWGFPTSFYVGGKRLGDFSIKPDVYNFKVPSPEPDLSKLREGIHLNEEVTEQYLAPKLMGYPTLDLDKARELFLPDFSRVVEEEDDEEEEIFE